MKEEELHNTLDMLLASSENEVVEFKEAKNSYEFTKIGKYFSTLCNEANLKGKPNAWLIFGVEDRKHDIVGTSFKKSRKELDKLKADIANKTTNRITFKEIFEVLHSSGKRVVMFQIPAAPKGIPIAFDGHYYGRDGEELGPLNLQEIERIRAVLVEDWSMALVPTATLADLDKHAILFARENYKSKFPTKALEVDSWDDITFLNKVKVTIKGNITRTAIVLLGKEESEHFISPSEAKIRWLLQDKDGVTLDHLIVGCPLLLAVDKVYNKIRNRKHTFLPEGTLFPDETYQYEPFSIREAINNCIAHQDYTANGRINVIEQEDKLIFTNLGTFIPGSVERVVKDDAPEEHYRNRFLVAAMVNLNMVETIGSGIKRIFKYQSQRFFPLPDYDLSDNRVKVTIMGKILDPHYASLLAKHTDLTLGEIILLDKVQKGKPLSAEEAKYLKSKNLIEGRKPNYYFSATISQVIGQKATYSKNKAFDKEYYLDLISKSLAEHGSLTRKEVDELLWSKLPDILDDDQKRNRISYILAQLRKEGKIVNKGNKRDPDWGLPN